MPPLKQEIPVPGKLHTIELPSEQQQYVVTNPQAYVCNHQYLGTKLTLVSKSFDWITSEVFSMILSEEHFFSAGIRRIKAKIGNKMAKEQFTKFISMLFFNAHYKSILFFKKMQIFFLFFRCLRNIVLNLYNDTALSGLGLGAL